MHRIFGTGLWIGLLLIFELSFSQTIRDRYDNITINEMKNLPSGIDTSAVAVVLYEGGNYDVTDKTFTRMVRIKILKPEGLEYAKFSLPTDYRSGIKGVTYNLENGEIIKSYLASSEKFKEINEGEVTNINIALPNIKVGSVFDLVYVEVGFPFIWYIQRDIPVVENELVLPTELPSGMRLKKRAAGGSYKLEWLGDKTIARNIPALSTEDYVMNINNHRLRIDVEILEMMLDRRVVNMSSSLQKTNEFMLDFYLKDLLADNFGIKQAEDSLESLHLTGKELLRAAFEYAKIIKWNNVFSFGASNITATVFKEKRGNSFDINLLLYKLLKRLKFNPSLIGIATNHNTPLSPIDFPTVSRYNNLLVSVKVEESQFFLDASEELLPYDILPYYDLNVPGIIINKEASDLESIVMLEPDERNRSIIRYNIEMDDANILTGTLTSVFEDYNAFDFRKFYKKFNSELDYITEIEKENDGLKIKSSRLEHLDDIYKPVKVYQDIEIENKAVVSGNEVYLHPLLFEKTGKNPFTAVNRHLPIEYYTKKNELVTITIKIPETYSVSSIPKSRTFVLGDGSIKVTYEYKVSAQNIYVNRNFTRTRVSFPAEAYSDLKMLYDECIKLESEPIILVKK